MQHSALPFALHLSRTDVCGRGAVKQCISCISCECRLTNAQDSHSEWLRWWCLMMAGCALACMWCIVCHHNCGRIAGAKFLTNEEAQMVGELNMRHSHATHDLYNRILEGNPPEWTWYVQVSHTSQFSAHVAGSLMYT